MDAISQLLTGVFALAVLLGASAQASRFCLQGGLREAMVESDPRRLSAYFVAVGAALVMVGLLQFALGMGFEPTRPPYLSADLMWGRNVVGGLLFGVGMVLTRGCPLRTLVRVGQGSVQALVLLAVMAAAAYVMTRTDLYATAFAPWMSGWSMDLRRWGSAHQDLGTLFGLQSAGARLMLSLTLGAAVLGIAARKLARRAGKGMWIGAIAIAAAVAAAYALTASPLGSRAMEDAAFMTQPPYGMGVQSFTFAGPLGDAVYYALHPSRQTLSFGVVAIVGALLGALASALARRDFRLQGLAGLRQSARQVTGAVLVGVGSVLALGCTVGHGLSGVSVLSVGSMLGLASTLLGAWLAIRLEAWLPVARGAAVKAIAPSSRG